MFAAATSLHFENMLQVHLSILVCVYVCVCVCTQRTYLSSFMLPALYKVAFPFAYMFRCT